MKLVLEKKNRINIILAFGAILYILFHFITLEISPLPWFDETFMLNVAKNKFEFDAYFFSIAPPYESGGSEVLIYGPLYFFMTSFVFKLFGIGIFQYRIIGVLFAFLVLGFIYLLGKKNRIFLVVLIAFDPLFMAASHSGRMDAMALALALGAVYLFFESDRRNNLWFLLGAGTLSGLTLLTTPRAFVTLFGLGFLLLINVARYRTKESIYKSIIWGVPLVVLYGIWVVSAFGNVEGLLNYYESLETGGFVQFFNIRISSIQKPLIIVLIVTLFWSIFQQKAKFFTDKNIVYLSSIFVFYMLIFDTGVYSILILPFVYFLIVDNMPTIKFDNRIVFKVIILFNFLLFLLKGTILFFERNQRNHEKIVSFIASNIPEGARIVGDEMYYYAAIENNNSFQYYHLYKTIDVRYEYQKNIFKYEYVILSDRFKPTAINRLYVKNQCDEIATFTSKKSIVAQTILKYLPIKLLNEYDCVIYKVKK